MPFPASPVKHPLRYFLLFSLAGQTQLYYICIQQCNYSSEVLNVLTGVINAGLLDNNQPQKEAIDCKSVSLTRCSSFKKPTMANTETTKETTKPMSNVTIKSGVIKDQDLSKSYPVVAIITGTTMIMKIQPPFYGSILHNHYNAANKCLGLHIHT